MRRCLRFVPLLILVVAACGPLPRPFQPESKEDFDLAAYEPPAEILVRPLEQDAPGDPAWAAESMAHALRDLGVSASASSQIATYTLSGEVSVQPAAGQRDEILIAWELRQTDGERVGGYAQLVELPAGLWRDGQAGAVASVMAEAAPAIVDMREQAVAAAETTQDRAQRHVIIVPLENAPGDGGASLAQALEFELRAAAIPLAREITDNDILVVGDMALGPPERGWQDFRITWFVIQASDGADLGQIDQRNQVPAGSLDGAWGNTAFDIARGAAEGIVELLSRLRRG